MTEAKTFKYKTNLARKMAAPGGRSAEAALQAAEGALEAHRESAMLSLRDIQTELEKAAAERRQRAIYEQASALLDLSGFFDTGPLHMAVFSLCEISDPGAAALWDWPSVEVHVRAIRRILNSGCRMTEESGLLLEGLVAVRQRLLGLPEAARSGAR